MGRPRCQRNHNTVDPSSPGRRRAGRARPRAVLPHRPTRPGPGVRHAIRHRCSHGGPPRRRFDRAGGGLAVSQRAPRPHMAYPRPARPPYRPVPSLPCLPAFPGDPGAGHPRCRPALGARLLPWTPTDGWPGRRSVPTSPMTTLDVSRSTSDRETPRPDSGKPGYPPPRRRIRNVTTRDQATDVHPQRSSAGRAASTSRPHHRRGPVRRDSDSARQSRRRGGGHASATLGQGGSSRAVRDEGGHSAAAPAAAVTRDSGARRRSLRDSGRSGAASLDGGGHSSGGRSLERRRPLRQRPPGGGGRGTRSRSAPDSARATVTTSGEGRISIVLW